MCPRNLLMKNLTFFMVDFQIFLKILLMDFFNHLTTLIIWTRFSTISSFYSIFFIFMIAILIILFTAFLNFMLAFLKILNTLAKMIFLVLLVKIIFFNKKKTLAPIFLANLLTLLTILLRVLLTAFLKKTWLILLTLKQF